MSWWTTHLHEFEIYFPETLEILIDQYLEIKIDDCLNPLPISIIEIRRILSSDKSLLNFKNTRLKHQLGNLQSEKYKLFLTQIKDLFKICILDGHYEKIQNLLQLDKFFPVIDHLDLLLWLIDEFYVQADPKNRLHKANSDAYRCCGSK